jgi:flagellar basal body-associated protein FliL
MFRVLNSLTTQKAPNVNRKATKTTKYHHSRRPEQQQKDADLIVIIIIIIISILIVIATVCRLVMRKQGPAFTVRAATILRVGLLSVQTPSQRKTGVGLYVTICSKAQTVLETNAIRARRNIYGT